MILVHAPRPAARLVLSPLESARQPLVSFRSTVRLPGLLLATCHPYPVPSNFSPLTSNILSFHIDPHSASVTPLFLTLSSKTREGEGRANKNPRQIRFSNAFNPSFRVGIPTLTLLNWVLCPPIKAEQPNSFSFLYPTLPSFTLPHLLCLLYLTALAGGALSGVN